jgi:hypothetical protein
VKEKHYWLADNKRLKAQANRFFPFLKGKAESKSIPSAPTIFPASFLDLIS